jgi:hypothetical protein
MTDALRRIGAIEMLIDREAEIEDEVIIVIAHPAERWDGGFQIGVSEGLIFG